MCKTLGPLNNGEEVWWMESSCLKTKVVTSEVDASLSWFSFSQSGLTVEPDLLLFSVSSLSKAAAYMAPNQSRFREMLACCTWHYSCDLQSTASVFQPHLCRASCNVLSSPFCWVCTVISEGKMHVPLHPSLWCCRIHFYHFFKKSSVISRSSSIMKTFPFCLLLGFCKPIGLLMFGILY